MIYEYECPLCNHIFDVVKSYRRIDDPEFCPKCKEKCKRNICFQGSFSGHDDWDKAEFNPGLGCITKNSKHRKEIAKSRGLEEVGNIDVDKWIKSDRKKIDDRIRESYDRIEPRIE
jgi:putative FmdB family regulatory protein